MPVPPAWYCLRTAGRDTRARLYLTRAGLPTFRPEIHRYSYTQGRERKRELNLFPGYLFAWLDSSSDLARAQNCIGVAQVLGHRVEGSADRRPSPMPAHWVQALIDAGPIIQNRKAEPKIGGKVRVAIGRLSSTIATIEAIDKNHKLCISMTIFGASHSIKIDAASCELVPE